MEHTTKDKPRQAFANLAVWLISICLSVGFWVALGYAIEHMKG